MLNNVYNFLSLKEVNFKIISVNIFDLMLSIKHITEFEIDFP